MDAHTRRPRFLASFGQTEPTLVQFARVAPAGTPRAREYEAIARAADAAPLFQASGTPGTSGSELAEASPAPASLAPEPPAHPEVTAHAQPGSQPSGGEPAADVASFGPPAPPPSASPAAVAHEARVVAAVTALRAQSERLAEQARSDILEIGFAVARRILEQEISASPQPLFGFIRAAIQRAGESRQLRVRLAPSDHERVEEARHGGNFGGLSLATIELVRDPSLSSGDVVVEGGDAAVDGRLSTRLAELARAVEEARDEVA